MAANTARYEDALDAWMRGAAGGQEKLKAAFRGSMALSSKQRRLLFEHHIFASYAQIKGFVGGSQHQFFMLMHNSLFGIVDFSDGAIRAAPEAVGGPIIVCNGGGGYVYVADRGTSDRMNLDKRKGVGLNYAQAAVFEATHPQFYGLRDLMWEEKGETTGITDTAISAKSSVKIINGVVQPRTAPFKVPYHMVCSEMTFEGGQSRLFSTLSSFIPRGREDGTARTRELTQDTGAGREVVTWKQVIQPAVMILGSNRVSGENQLERGEAIAHVCRCVMASPVHHDTHTDAGGSVPAKRDHFRNVFLDGQLAGTLVAFIQREGGIGEVGEALPTQKAILQLFMSNLAGARYMDHALLSGNMLARIARGAETRAVCRTMILTGATQFDREERESNAVRNNAKAAINCKFNPIALEIVPAMLADWLEQRLNTALIGIIGVFCVELQVPCYPLDTLLQWMATGVFPPHPNMQHFGPARLSAWLLRMTEAERVFEHGQVWITKNGEWGEMAHGEQNPFHNPQQPNANLKFRHSLFQCKEQRDFVLGEFCAELGAALLREEHFKEVLYEGFFMEARQAEFAIKHALAAPFHPERGFLDNTPNIRDSRAMMASLGMPVPDGFEAAREGKMLRHLTPTPSRPAESLAVDLRLLLLVAALISPRQAMQEGCMRRQHVTLACKYRWVCSVLQLFMAKIPQSMFPFPKTTLEIPGESRDVSTLTIPRARTMRGKARQMLRREGVRIEPDEAERQDEDVCTKNIDLNDRLEFYVAPTMRQGDCDLSPTRLVEDVAPCDALLVACRCLALTRLRDFPPRTLQAQIYPAQYTPVVHRASGTVRAYLYKPARYRRTADVPGVLTVYEGSPDPERHEPASPATLDALQLVHVPRFFRPGVLLFIDEDDAAWLDKTDGRFADAVAMREEDMRHTGRETAGAYAVLVPHSREDDGLEQWFNEELAYKVDVTADLDAPPAHKLMGASEVRRSLVPYGADLLVNFTYLMALNESSCPHANKPWFVVPGVSHRHKQEAHIWATLSYIDEDDARCWDGQTFLDQSICVLVCEFATDFQAYSVDDEGAEVPTGRRVRRRHVVGPWALRPMGQVKPEVRRAEYFVYTGALDRWFGYFTRK